MERVQPELKSEGYHHGIPPCYICCTQWTLPLVSVYLTCKYITERRYHNRGADRTLILDCLLKTLFHLQRCSQHKDQEIGFKEESFGTFSCVSRDVTCLPLTFVQPLFTRENILRCFFHHKEIVLSFSFSRNWIILLILLISYNLFIYYNGKSFIEKKQNNGLT